MLPFIVIKVFEGPYMWTYLSPFFGLHRLLKEKDNPGTFLLGTFPFVSFYGLSKIRTITYEKARLWVVFELFSRPLIEKIFSIKLGFVHAHKII